jgi:hypothetical protein
MSTLDIPIATTTLWGWLTSSLKGLSTKNSTQHEDDYLEIPEQLESAVKPIYSEIFTQLEYAGAPKFKNVDALEALLDLMYKQAIEIGQPLDTPRSSKGFRQGFSLGLVSKLSIRFTRSMIIDVVQLCYPGHLVEVQAYVGIFTWLLVQYDDIVRQDEEMMEDALRFHDRLYKGEKQPNPLLEGIARLLRESYNHFDPVMANMLQISLLIFLTSNLLERQPGFLQMPITAAGTEFPNFFRDMSGLSVAYTVFCYPKKQYPDIELYLEAIPDIAKYINHCNDLMS